MMAAMKLNSSQPHWPTKSEQNWHDAGEQIAKLVEQMPALKELTYVYPLLATGLLANRLQLDLRPALHGRNLDKAVHLAYEACPRSRPACPPSARWRE